MSNVMKRQVFSLRRRTSVAQKLPGDFEQMHVACQAYVVALRQRSNFLLGQIGNTDETPIWFDMPSNTTVAERKARKALKR